MRNYVNYFLYFCCIKYILPMKRQLFLYAFILCIIPLWATPKKGSYYFEQAENFDAYSMGNGKVHVKVLIFAEGKDNNYNAGLGQNYDSGQFGNPKAETGARLWTQQGNGSAKKIIFYYRADNHYNKPGSSSDPKDMGTAWFKVMDGIVEVTNTYNNAKMRVLAGNQVLVEVKRSDSGDHLTYLEFDWYPSAAYDEVEYTLGVTSDHHKSGGSDYNDKTFTLGTFTGARGEIAPMISDAFPAMGNQLGKDAVGKMAMSFTTMQPTHKYYTSLDATPYACFDQNGMLYVDMTDTVITGFRACFQTTRSSDEITKQWLWSNRVNISAYHAIHDFSIGSYEYERDGRYYRNDRYKTITWKIYHPKETDVMEGDMFELQRAYQPDFSDAETIELIPMEYDSTLTQTNGDIEMQTYSFVDSAQAAWYNPYRKSYRIYYRVRRTSSAAWGWEGHNYAASAISPEPFPIYQQEGFATSGHTAVLDPDFAENHKVHLSLSLINFHAGQARTKSEPGRSAGFWSDNARLVVHKILEEINDTIDIVIPNEHVRHCMDSIFYHPDDNVFSEGKIVVNYTDIVSTPCVHYKYIAEIDTTDIQPIKAVVGRLQRDVTCDSEIYYTNMAGIDDFTASQEEYPDYVLLTWRPTDGKVGYYTLEGRPEGASEYTLIADSLTDAWYRDYAAWPEQSWNWEYRLTLHYDCQGTKNTTSATAVGSRFHYGSISGRIMFEDGVGCEGITISASLTTTGEVVRTAVTDETGAYVLDSLPYMYGTEYTIQPTAQSAVFRYNNTSAGSATIGLASNNNIIKNINFENISCVRFSGRVLYENTTIPVRDAQFLLNGKMVKLTSEPYKTDASGNFEFRVPQGSQFTLQAYKEGHRFAGDGFVRIDGDSLLSLSQPLDGVRIYDQTTIRLTGRLVGGQNQAEKPLGFGLSSNNLGDDLQLVMELEGDNISQIVHIPSDLTIDRIDTLMQQVVEAEGSTKLDTVGSTQVQYLRKRIIIRPDVTTGEYVVDLYPVKYKITQATARGYSTLYADGKSSETLDLTNAPLRSIELSHNGKKTTANEIYSITYHSPIDLSCKQLRYGIELPYFGEEKIIRQNIQNEQVATPLVEKNADNTYTYLFGAPVFGMDDYTFRVSAHEDYYYNNDPTSTRHEEVRIKSGLLKIYNGMYNVSNTQIQSKQLDDNGEAVFTIPIDYVSFLKTGDDALRVLDLSLEYEGAHVDKQVIRAYVMGNKAKGQDFVTSTTGDVVLLDILRDPPGSKSYAYLEAGTSYKYSYSWNVNFKFGLNINFGVGAQTTLAVGTYAGMGAGIFAGQVSSYSSKKTFSIPIQSSYYYKHSASYTFTLSDRVETGSDSYFVGETGDIYLGVVQNVYYGLTDAVKPIDSLTYAAFASQFANGTMRVVKSGRDSKGEPWYLVIGLETEVGTYMNSSFIYTHDYIKQTLIPKLKRERDALLLSGDSASVQNIANQQGKAVYWTKVEPDDENFASDGYYRQLLPEGSDMIVADEVSSYNRLIAGWIKILIRNEAEKINAIHSSNSSKVGQWSVSGSAKVQHNETYEYSNTYTSKVDFPGTSVKFGPGVLAAITKSWGTNIGRSVQDAVLKTMDKNENPRTPIDLATEAPGSKWEFDFTPIIDLDFAYDPANGTTHTKKTGFTLQTDNLGYMDVSVYRVEDKKHGFNDDSDDTRDMVDADDYLYGSYVYYLNGGASRCPWESTQYTQYYEPQMMLSAGTLNLENQKIDIDVHERNNVPADQPAIFNLRMTNEGEHEFGGGTVAVTFNLKQDEISNPKGAKLFVDGMPLTGDGRAIKIKHGQIINKTLEVYAGEGYDFENIVLNLASTCDPLNAAKCTFSVHFMPVSCNVNLSMPRDNWTMNTLSARDSIGWYLPVVIDGFDVNYKGFDHIELQYKLATQSEDAWVNLCSYYADDSLYQAASGTKEMITGGRIENVRFYGERDPMEQQYDLRAVSFCRYGSGFITRSSDVRRGMKDTRPPRVFGDPQPVDAVLGVGDNLLLRFNEAIAGNYLDEDNNFQILGSTNNIGLTAGTSVRFDGTDNSYAMTPVGNTRNLADKSFSVDLLVKPANPNSEEVFASHGLDGEGFRFGKTADNRLFVEIPNVRRFYSQTIEPITDFTRVIFTYNNDNSTIRFYAGTKDVTDYSAMDELFYYTIDAPIVLGRGFNGSMMEARLWTKVLTPADISQTHMKRLTGYELMLLAYYPMNEGRGDIITDKAHGATLTIHGATWNITQGASMAFKGHQTLRLNSDVLSRSAVQDLTLMFWFKTQYHEARLFSAGVYTWIGIEKGMLMLRSDSMQWHIGNYSDNEWHHFVLSVNRTFNNVSIFIDGKMTNTFAATSLAGINGAMYLGGSYDGYIGDLVLYEQALPKTIVNAYNNIIPRGDEMGLITYLPFYERKENANGIMETVFSPNDQRIITDSEGNIVNKVTPLVLALENYLDGSDLGDPASIFNKTEYPPVHEQEHLVKLKFDWAFNNDELLININMPTKEINKQLVYVTVRDVEDINGNPMASPVMWAAFVDKNSLKWDENELKFSTAEDAIDGWATISTTVTNISGLYHQYSIDALPSWLTMDEPSGTIGPLETKRLYFKYKLGLPVGKYSEIIYLTDENGLSDPFKVNYDVDALPLFYDIDVHKYPLNMSICGQVLLTTNEGHQIYDTNEDDIVYAIYHNECVGMAHVAFNNLANTTDLYLTVHGNEDMFGKTIRFQLWESSTGKVYNLTTDNDILFANGAVHGCGDQEPVLFTTGGSEMLSVKLESGWNWISVPLDMTVTNGDLMSSITATNPWIANDQIKNPETRQFANYDVSADTFVGTLNSLHYSQIYMFYSAEGNTMRVSGERLSPDSMQITVHGDGQWSAMPCFFEQPTAIDEALTDYYDKAQPGDLIKAHNRFSTMSKNGKWVGDLTSLRPGEGYLFRRMGQGDALISFYNVGIHSVYAPRKMPAQDVATFSNPAAENNMTMICTLADADRDAKVMVLQGSTLVGMAQQIDSLYFITIQSNNIGEPLTFITNAGQRLEVQTAEQQTDTSIDYTPNAHHGSVESPIVLAPAGTIGNQVYKIIENGHVIIIRNNQRYDVTGKKLN